MSAMDGIAATVPLMPGPTHSRTSSAGVSGREMTLNVTCKGIEGQVVMTADGFVEYHPTKIRHFGWHCLPGGQRGHVPLQYSGSDIVGAMLDDKHTFRIWFCPGETSKQGIIRRACQSPPFTCSSPEEAARWVEALRSMGSWQGNPHPRYVTVIINPFSGRSRGNHVFKKRVLPILEAGGLGVTVHQTERAGHATELVRDLDIKSCDVLVGVGGDGTIFEMLQGYFQRPDWKEAVRIPFTQVPAGSGNALTANTAILSPESAAFAICKGQTSPLDIVSVLQRPGLRLYSFLSTTYGYVANLDVGTDNLRWMGPTRFTVGAVKEIFAKRSYPARVAFVPATQHAAGLVDPSAKDQAAVLEGTLLAGVSAGPQLPLLEALGSDAVIDLQDPQTLPEGWSMLPTQDLAIFAACNLKWLDHHTPMALDAGLNTGCMDVIYSGPLTVRDGIDAFTKVGDGAILQSPQVSHVKAAALIMEPLCTGTSLAVDGEVIPYQRFFAEVHPGLCNVIVA